MLRSVRRSHDRSVRPCGVTDYMFVSIDVFRAIVLQVPLKEKTIDVATGESIDKSVN